MKPQQHKQGASCRPSGLECDRAVSPQPRDRQQGQARGPAPTGEASRVGATPRGCPVPGNPGHDLETSPPPVCTRRPGGGEQGQARGPAPTWMPASRVGATPRGCPVPGNPGHDPEPTPPTDANRRPGGEQGQARGPAPTWMFASRVGATPCGCPSPITTHSPIDTPPSRCEHAPTGCMRGSAMR